MRIFILKIRLVAAFLLFVSVFIPLNSVFAVRGNSNNEEFNIKVDVRLKLFDVLVFDSDEKPIKNLRKEQFKIFIDDKEVEIGTFDIIDYVHRQQLQKIENKDAGQESDSRLSEDDTSVNRRLFIIIFHNLPWAEDARREIAEGIFKFIDDNHSPDDYYALYFFSGPSIKLLLPFTNNSQSIKDVINELYINNNAGFKPFLPGAGDRIRSVQDEFGSEGMIDIVTAGSMERMDPEFSDYISTDYMDAKTIHEMNATLRNLDVLLRSFSSFKGRKEVLFLSDSISLKGYNPTRGFLGRGKSGIDYDRLIQDAKTNNITINSFKVVQRNPFAMSQSVKISTGLSPSETDQQEGMTQKVRPSINKALSRKLSNDLKVLAEETGGLYFEKAARQSAVTKGLKEVYNRASYVYYLGIYLNNLVLDNNKEHLVRIETVNEDALVIYQHSFHVEPEYKEMDVGDRLSQFLDALFGIKKYDELHITDSLLRFPYGQNGNLLISVFRLPLSEDMGNVLNFAVRYYNLPKIIDKLLLRSWHIGKKKDERNADSAKFIIGIPLEDGEYIYRYLVRDEEKGLLKSAGNAININSGRAMLSSPVVFGNAGLTASFTNLLDFKNNHNQGSEAGPDFIVDKDLNPLIYDDKLFAPLINEPIVRSEDAYLMFMYKYSSLSGAGYSLSWSLLTPDELDLSGLLIPSREEKEYPGGWRRVTLKISTFDIPPGIKNLKFVVAIKDSSGKQIESQEALIKIQ